MRCVFPRSSRSLQLQLEPLPRRAHKTKVNGDRRGGENSCQPPFRGLRTVNRGPRRPVHGTVVRYPVAALRNAGMNHGIRRNPPRLRHGQLPLIDPFPLRGFDRGRFGRNSSTHHNPFSEVCSIAAASGRAWAGPVSPRASRTLASSSDNPAVRASSSIHCKVIFHSPLWPSR